MTETYSSETTQLCPRCEQNRFTPYGVRVADVGEPHMRQFPFPALSRVDNTTYICTPCGQDEAMRDFAGAGPVPLDEWPIPAEVEE